MHRTSVKECKLGFLFGRTSFFRFPKCAHFIFFDMKYKEFKRARKIGKDERNASLLRQIGECEDILGVCEWLKSNENKDKDGKPRFTATVTLNLHGRESDDSDAKDLRSVSYDTNLDYVEKKARDMYDRLIAEFEDMTGD